MLTTHDLKDIRPFLVAHNADPTAIHGLYDWIEERDEELGLLVRGLPICSLLEAVLRTVPTPFYAEAAALTEIGNLLERHRSPSTHHSVTTVPITPIDGPQVFYHRCTLHTGQNDFPTMTRSVVVQGGNQYACDMVRPFGLTMRVTPRSGHCHRCDTRFVTGPLIQFDENAPELFGRYPG